MNGKKAKAIRRFLREQAANEPQNQQEIIAHPKLFVDSKKRYVLRYTLQYVNSGVKGAMKMAKQLFREGGTL
jgi:hypothetical protein